jgi:hypothetical protein
MRRKTWHAVGSIMLCINCQLGTKIILQCPVTDNFGSPQWVAINDPVVTISSDHCPATKFGEPQERLILKYSKY